MTDGSREPSPDDRIVIDGEVVTVVAVTSRKEEGVELVVRHPTGELSQAFVRHVDLAISVAPKNDGRGDSERVLTCLWAKWIEGLIPRIRSAVLATTPLTPFPHQDEGVFDRMLPQPRLRFLLADEPGAGKTIMAGMYYVEGRRRGLIPGKSLLIVPAHLVEKWILDLGRFFSLRPSVLTSEIGRQPHDLRPDIDLWIVSLDLYTYNEDVRRKVAGPGSSWSLIVVDEAHRLTPTAQYLGASRQVARVSHHLLLMTATPHRGKEHLFRALLNLLDEGLYPWSIETSSYGQSLRPSDLHFLRRMKEEMKDVDGQPLFPPRFAKTEPVQLTGSEVETYESIMEYVDRWYGEYGTLARSVYGKRAASSMKAAYETLNRRHESLLNVTPGQVSAIPPRGFEDERFANASLEDEEAWRDAEDVVVQHRSRDRKAELRDLEVLLVNVQRELRNTQVPSKWEVAEGLFRKHHLLPGVGEDQLLVFTEFADTAHWLESLFVSKGFSIEVLEGGVGLKDRHFMQQRFLAREFQVLISTDAGGEGIDLQSANVMINWDIPWSLVKLEQRMGRLHRIGQTREVFVYHLVAPATREGRVQEIMLHNLDEAGRALDGRIFDLLDATAERLGFDYAAALVDAQRPHRAAPESLVPGVDALVNKARELVREEDRLRTPTDVEGARARFAADRLEAINPVIVEGFVHQLAKTQRWHTTAGPAAGLTVLSSNRPFEFAPSVGNHITVAADGAAVRKAAAEGVDTSEVLVLGPTEPSFRFMVTDASRNLETDLIRGATLSDPSSLTNYVLFAFEVEAESHDGVKRQRHLLPVLVRFSGEEAFQVGWELVMKLTSVSRQAERPPPSALQLAREAAERAVAEEHSRVSKEKVEWVDKARNDLENIGTRYLQQIREYPDELRANLRKRFTDEKGVREEQLFQISQVTFAKPSLIGWVNVKGTVRPDQLGWDPNSEGVAITTVLSELERLEFSVDDRQTAGVGYDLFASHPRTGEQRLVEVKGCTAEIHPITLEANEWAQAQQRGKDYWLYIVIRCSTEPVVYGRIQDPAGVLDGPRLIERFQIPVSRLRAVVEGT